MNFKWETAAMETDIHIRSIKEQSAWMDEFSDEWSRPFLIVDSAVRKLWESRLKLLVQSASGLFVMEAREEQKNISTLTRIWNTMSDRGIHRDTPVVVIGGGLVCDTGAMAASTYMRGLKLMLVPTTLLCMVDACLGGKTGLNLSGAKNQLGTFYPAEKVVISVEFLETLPGSEFRSGIAEIIKTAILGDRSIRKSLDKIDIDNPDKELMIGMVRKCLEVKGGIVAGDLRETGNRMILNLGHTIGHALESSSGFHFSHGEAVGLGLIGESAIAASLGGNKNLPGEIRQLLKQAGLPSTISGFVAGEKLFSMFNKDKKTRKDGRIWSLPFDWSDCRLTLLTSDQEEEFLPEAMNLLMS